MKKLFVRLVLLGLIALLAAPFVLKKQDGQPMLTREQFIAFDMRSIQYAYQTVIGHITNFFVRNTGDRFSEDVFESDSETTRLYRWQDEKGEWHFSDRKPANTQAEKIEIRNNQNVFNFGDMNQDKSNKKSGESGGGFVDSIKHKLDKAKSVQQTLDKDFEQKSEAIEH